MYVYTKHSEDLYLVGFYNPKGSFVVESEHEFSEDAARRVNFLNGGTNMDELANILHDLK